MISLFLNTSSSLFNACLYKDGNVVGSICERYGKDLSKEALYKITVLLDENNISVDMIDEVICVRGPGSFTGLRIGVTIAKTMAYFMNIKLVSASSLDVMATSVVGDVIVPIIDARRGYVYGAIYDKNYDVLMEESYIKLDDLLKKVKNYSAKPIFVSLDKFDFDTTLFKPKLDNFYKYGKRREEDSMIFVPSYLKKTEAEEKLNDKRD
jgi:tRNA threonylcarbamoyl adenosine modification protein YeaZ